MGDNFKEIMTVEEARNVVRSKSPDPTELQKAEMALALSGWFGDQMVAFEMRKARFFNSI